MDRNFWAHACSAALKRPLPQLKEANNAANAFAVRRLSDCHALSSLPPSSDLYLLVCRCVQRGILFAGLQVAALEA